MKQNTTYKQTELGLIPDDWEVKKIGDICGIYIGKDVKKDCFSYKRTPDFKFPVFSNTVDNNGLYGFYNFEEYKQHNALTVVGRGIGLGTAFVRNNSFGAIGRLIVLYPNELTSNGYLTYYINSKVKFYTESSGIPQLTGEQICKYKICIPPFPEQKKIADCLSTWDSAIEKQSALINALTDRKKALMQQLLTGKKRLPGFEGKWNLNSINDLFNFKNGKAHENDIDENGKYILVNSKFISTDGEISKKTNSNLAPLEVNDLVFVMSDVPNGKALAKFCLIKEDNLYTLNQRIGLLKIKKGNPIFMYYLLNRNSYFLMFDNGVGQTNLRKDDILDCPLNIPSLSEQTAIAEILATADRELQLQKEKLAQLQIQKKGLMQVLLTGKKRLIN